MGRVWLSWGCFFGFMTVGLGAFAGHGLEHVLDAKRMAWIHTANTYMAYHTFALLALGLWNHWEKWSSSLAAGICFVFGILLFSGSLYALALADFDLAKYITPMGGVLLLLGWVQFAFSVLRTKNSIV